MKRQPASQNSHYVPIIVIACLIGLLFILSYTGATSTPIGGVDLDQVHHDQIKKLNDEEVERQRKLLHVEQKDQHNNNNNNKNGAEKTTAATVPVDHDHDQHQMHTNEPRPRVRLETAIGSITFELRPDAAPLTVANFLKLVKAGFYGPDKGASFYRAEMHDTEPKNDFCLQGGGWPVKTSPFPGVKIEYKLPNVKYAVSMARTSDPNSATSEFSIMLNDNSKWLAPHGSEPYGYAVFAHVVDGFELIEKIRKMERNKNGGLTYLKKRVEFTGAKIL